MNLSEEALQLYNEGKYQEVGVLLVNHEDDDGLTQYLIGSLYQLGVDREKNLDKAFEYYYKSAHNHEPRGERAIGIYYYQGYGCKVDEAKGLYWVKQSVEHGLVRSLCTLAHIYMNGMGVKKDEEEGFKLYKKAAEMGDNHAKEHLIECYTLGIGTKVDKEKAEQIKNEIK